MAEPTEPASPAAEGEAPPQRARVCVAVYIVLQWTVIPLVLGAL